MKKIRLFLIPLLIAALLSAEFSAYSAFSDAPERAAEIVGTPVSDNTGIGADEEPSPEEETPENEADLYERAIASKNQDRAPEQAVINSLPSFTPSIRRPYTVMIYMIGSNLESQYGSATKDMMEMEASGLDTGSANLLLYTGGCRSWKTGIPSNQNCIIDMHLPEEERIIATTESSADMGSPETLSSFINFCTSNYPAEHYMLILWDHGGGPLWGYGSDELFGSDSLLLSEMKAAMNATVFGRGRKLDLVGFDACLMGSYENMSLWSSYAKYYIGSEELEPGDGWDYRFLSTLNTSTDPREIADAITLDYASYYKEKTTQAYRPQITLSCTDLSMVSQVSSSLRKLFSRMENGMKTGDYPALSRIRSGALSFGRVQTLSGSYSYDLVDLVDLVTKLSALYPTESSALRSVLSDFVVSSVSTIENAGGISLFYPCENKGQFEKMSSLYKTINISTAYSRFLDNIAAEWLSAKSRDWDLGSLETVNGELLLQLTDEQLENMDSVYYTVLAGDSGSYVPLLDKCTLTPDRKGIVHIPADPKIFYLDNGGADRTAWDVSQTGRSRTRIYYQTNRMLLYSDANPLGHLYGYDTKNVYINFSTDLRGGNLKIGGITTTASSFDTMGKETVDLRDWEAVSHAADRRVPTRDLQGRLLPASQWNTNSLTTIYSAAYKNDFTFGLAPASTLSDDCVCQVVLEDVNGEAYATELCPIQSEEYRPVTLETEDGSWDFLVYGDHASLVGFTGSSTQVTVPAAAEGVPVTEIYSGAFGNYTIGDRYGSSPLRSIVLPNTLQVLHGNAFYHCTKLRSITLPDGLTTIGEMAFSGCQSLQEIVIPSSVTSIGNLAFDSCYALESVTLPPSLDYLGKSLFMDCNELKSITGEAEAGYRLIDGALYDGDGTVLIACPVAETGAVTVADGTLEIGCGAFTNGAWLTQILLPQGLERIGSYAFFNCQNLTVPALPDSLVYIGMQAFGTIYRGVDPATLPDEPVEIYLGPAMQNIGSDAFTGIGFRTFTVSEENSVFAAVDGHLTNKAKDRLIALAADPSFAFVIPEGILAFDWDEFDPFQTYDFPYFETPMVRFVFPDSVTSVTGTGSRLSGGHLTIHASPGSAAQLWAKQNNQLYSSDPVWSWQVRTFPTEEGTLYARLAGDHAVILYYEGTDDPLVIPDTLEGLPVTILGGGEYPIMMPKYYSDYNYSELGIIPNREATLPKTLILPDTLTTLAAHCMEGLYVLENVELPESITVIDDRALGRLSNKKWELPHNLSYVGSNFVAGYDGPFTVSPSLEHLSPSAFQSCSNMAGFVQEGENGSFSVRDGLLCSADGKTLLCCLNSSVKDGGVTVPEGTEIIGEYAFQCAPSLRWVDLPASLRTISDRAFQSQYNLSELRFAQTDGPLTVGSYAFAYCSALKEVSLPSTTHNLGAYAFCSCRALERVILPEDLLTIDEYAFSYCTALKEVVFNDKLTYIGNYAFNNNAKLTKVDLPDSLVTLGRCVFPEKMELPLEELEPFTLHLGADLRSIGYDAFGALPIQAFEVDPANRFFSASDDLSGTPGLLLSKNGSQLICCPPALKGTVVVSRSVSMILYNAFVHSNMTDVFIPETVLDISSEAFRLDYTDQTDEATGQGIRYYYYGFTIHCPHGSIAEEYAIRREIPYVNE